MTLHDFKLAFLLPGLERLAGLGGPRVTDDATRLLLAIALQESQARFRYQFTNDGDPGPARGYWQFERGGGVHGVMQHKASRAHAIALCNAQQVQFNSHDIWRAIEGNDIVAAGFARLLLWTDPKPLPRDEDGAWACYLRCWRPGKPHPKAWPNYWAAALAEVPLAP